MPHTDTSKSQATTRIPCHASHRYQQIGGSKSYTLPCLAQISANHRQQIVDLAIPHTGIPRYQQITGNKPYTLPSLSQIPTNPRQQIIHLAMPLTDTSKSQATNRIPYHASYRYQQIAGNKSYTLPCPAQIPANRRQQIVLLAMPRTDTSKSLATNRTPCHAAHRYQQISGNKSYTLPCLTQIPSNHRQQTIYLAMLLIDTSKSQATNRTPCHASYRYQQTTDNKSYTLPCPAQIPANSQTKILSPCHTAHRYRQITGNKSYTHAPHRYQQIPHNPSYTLP